MSHELKIAPAYYSAVASGDKTFEIRVDDRGFQKGDTCLLREWDGCYTHGSKPIQIVITYVTAFQQKDGWVVFGFKRVKS